MFRIGLTALALIVPASLPPVPTASAPPGLGVLLLAHGGKSEWNANVETIAREVGRQLPVEVAFGMADRRAIDQALARLYARGVTEVVAVPLFVSSHSSVLDATRFLLGLRAEKPAAVEAFARMAHGSGHDSGHAPVSTEPLTIGFPIRMASALDAHPIVGQIVLSRTLSLSREPSAEAVVLVAHGPEEDDVDAKWMVNLEQLADVVRAAAPFRHVGALTLRDDADAPVRAEATRRLRVLVGTHLEQGARVLVVPVLLSFGGIEAGLRDRLEGLAYELAPALAPDPRLVDWVLAQAAAGQVLKIPASARPR